MCGDLYVRDIECCTILDHTCQEVWSAGYFFQTPVLALALARVSHLTSHFPADQIHCVRFMLASVLNDLVDHAGE